MLEVRVGGDLYIQPTPSSKLLLVAGGIGITPVMSMVAEYAEVVRKAEAEVEAEEKERRRRGGRGGSNNGSNGSSSGGGWNVGDADVDAAGDTDGSANSAEAFDGDGDEIESAYCSVVHPPSVVLLYSASGSDELVYRSELEELAALGQGRIRVLFCDTRDSTDNGEEGQEGQEGTGKFDGGDGGDGGVCGDGVGGGESVLRRLLSTSSSSPPPSLSSSPSSPYVATHRGRIDAALLEAVSEVSAVGDATGEGTPSEYTPIRGTEKNGKAAGGDGGVTIFQPDTAFICGPAPMIEVRVLPTRLPLLPLLSSTTSRICPSLSHTHTHSSSVALILIPPRQCTFATHVKRDLLDNHFVCFG